MAEQREDYVLVRRDDVLNMIIEADCISHESTTKLSKKVLELDTYGSSEPINNITNINFITDDRKVQELIKSIKEHQNDAIGFDPDMKMDF